jgi:small subunit ribosomal protein S3
LAAKPGVIIGRSGQGLEDIRKEIEKKILGFALKVKLNIQAVANPALSAAIVAQSAADEIERRLPFRRVMKQAVQKVMSAGAKGVKMKMGGRLNGAEIARSEKQTDGKMSLITIRSNVDYATAEAQTMYGKIGIKVWIYHGETFGRHDKFEKKEANVNEPKPAARPASTRK